MNFEYLFKYLGVQKIQNLYSTLYINAFLFLEKISMFVKKEQHVWIFCQCFMYSYY